MNRVQKEKLFFGGSRSRSFSSPRRANVVKSIGKWFSSVGRSVRRSAPMKLCMDWGVFVRTSHCVFAVSWRHALCHQSSLIVFNMLPSGASSGEQYLSLKIIHASVFFVVIHRGNPTWTAPTRKNFPTSNPLTLSTCQLLSKRLPSPPRSGCGCYE